MLKNIFLVAFISVLFIQCDEEKNSFSRSFHNINQEHKDLQNKYRQRAIDTSAQRRYNMDDISAYNR